ncbi:proteasome activator complex subunit 3 [Scaptodrosophila lebanonensis]|uniref:Proteasome activator complex subunit 3 n=1 Tax=Drosophila lebanonensis TaxID=7225 RepID=A0A6J2TQX4_DROLE|nr:proteasome activator complex subunit 3 [Scaptodrosophila lebanonensis]XP_030379072.1 proteasome activator complex subunit 3 [Scaptodrosophila lebanonensis]
MPNDTISKVQEYKDSLITKAEFLITKGFPEKIVELNELLSTPMFNERNFSEVHQDLNIPVVDPVLVNNHDGAGGEPDNNQPATKRARLDVNITGTTVLSLPNGSVSCNKPLCEMIKVVKPIIRKLVEDSNLLKMWISFMIPKIEDGNNFGVSIQEDTLAEIQTVESEAAAFFDQISRYFLSRAKVVSKVAKYPHIDDYRRAVVELDEKEYLSLWLVVCEVRNRYSSLHDIVIKNLEKLKKPRSSNAESLY